MIDTFGFLQFVFAWVLILNHTTRVEIITKINDGNEYSYLAKVWRMWNGVSDYEM